MCCCDHTGFDCKYCNKQTFKRPRYGVCENACNSCKICFQEFVKGIPRCGHSIDQKCNKCDKFLIAGICPEGHTDAKCDNCNCYLHFGVCINCSPDLKLGKPYNFIEQKRREIGIFHGRLNFPNNSTEKIFVIDVPFVLANFISEKTKLQKVLVWLIVDFIETEED